MDLAQMGAFLRERHTFDLFRMETHRYYRSAGDVDFDVYLRGEPGPDLESRSGWLSMLRADAAAHRRWRKVHVVRGELTDYERYEMEWGFALNVAAGEDVRILEAAEESRLDEQVGDFFVADDRYVVLSHYDSSGRHSGAEVVTGRVAAVLIALRDLAWSRAIPFTEWWTAHPQYHRATQVA